MPSATLSAEQELEAALTGIKLPLGHGTDSALLHPILKRGFGEDKPAESFSPNENSLCIMSGRVAWISVLLFALREEALEGNLLEKYLDAANYRGPKRALAKLALTAIGRRYAKKRGTREGAPMILIYEGDGLELKRENAPTAVCTTQPLHLDRLRAIFVPESGIAETRFSIEEMGREMPVLALETVSEYCLS